MPEIGPQVLQVLEFASCRAPELVALHERATQPIGSGGGDDAGGTDSVALSAKTLTTQQNKQRRRANAFNRFQMPQRMMRRSNNNSNKRDKNNSTAFEIRCRKHRRRTHLLLAQRTVQNAHFESLKDQMVQEDQDQGQNQDQTPDPNQYKARVLTTHVWHAKRMHMSTNWGFSLASHRADKSISSALRALRQRAVLHDMSYYGVLELFGLPQMVLRALQLVSDPSGSDFNQSCFLSGRHEGRSMLYHAGQFPMGAICPVKFLWRPLASDFALSTDGHEGHSFELSKEWQSQPRQLWLWIHPAAFMEATDAISQACEAIAHETEHQEKNTNRVIEMHDRRGELSRFRVCGKRSSDMVLKICGFSEDLQRGGRCVEAQHVQEENSDHDDGFDPKMTARMCQIHNRKKFSKRVTSQSVSKSAHGPTSCELFTLEIPDPRSKIRYREQKQSEPELSLMNEPAAETIPEASILCPLSGDPLTLNDQDEEPSLDILVEKLQAIVSWCRQDHKASSLKHSMYPAVAGQRTEAAKPDVDMSCVDHLGLPCSSLWSSSKRNQMRQQFKPDHEMNQLVWKQRQQSKQTLRATTPGLEPGHPTIPLMIVSQPNGFHHGSGFDIILPPQNAPAVLNALSFAGTMMIGLEENAAIDTVLHLPSFPRDFPDTQSGKDWWMHLAKEQLDTYLRKPKAKRSPLNHDQLSTADVVAESFCPPFAKLFDNQQQDQDQVHGTASSTPSFCVLRGVEYIQAFNFYRQQAEEQELMPVAIPTLVRVSGVLPRRGRAVENTKLYLPTARELNWFVKDPHWNGLTLDLKQLRLRTPLGITTSAVYDKPKAHYRFNAFCSCERLQQAAAKQHALAHINANSNTKSAFTTGSFLAGEPTTMTLLALIHVPGSLQLRPALICAQSA